MKYLADIKSTFDSIVFEWDETKSNIQNVYDFTQIFLKITKQLKCLKKSFVDIFSYFINSINIFFI